MHEKREQKLCQVCDKCKQTAVHLHDFSCPGQHRFLTAWTVQTAPLLPALTWPCSVSCSAGTRPSAGRAPVPLPSAGSRCTASWLWWRPHTRRATDGSRGRILSSLTRRGSCERVSSTVDASSSVAVVSCYTPAVWWEVSCRSSDDSWPSSAQSARREESWEGSPSCRGTGDAEVSSWPSSAQSAHREGRWEGSPSCRGTGDTEVSSWPSSAQSAHREERWEGSPSCRGTGDTEVSSWPSSAQSAHREESWEESPSCRGTGDTEVSSWPSSAQSAHREESWEGSPSCRGTGDTEVSSWPSSAQSAHR